MKICGLTSEADAGLLIKYGADYGGVVVFYPKSKRDVTIKEAKIIVDILKKSDIKAVAVTVSPTVEQFIKYRKQVLIIFKFTAHLKRLYMRQTQFRL